MKKLLLILPLALCINVYAQTPKDNAPSKDMKSDTKMKDKDSKDSKSLTSLDGKAFKVTFQTRKGADLQNTSSTTRTSREATATPGTNAGQVQGGTGAAAGSDYNTAGTPNSPTPNTGAAATGNNGVVSGENANNTSTSGGATGTAAGTTHQSGSQTGNTNSAHQNPSGIGAVDNANPASNTGANTSPTNPDATGSGNISGTTTARDVPANAANDNANTIAPTDNTSAVPAPSTTTTADTKTGMSDKDESLTNTKMIIRFENGMIRSSTLGAKGINDCAYRVNSSDGNILSFSSNCKSSVSKVQGMWSGIVEGNSIRGNFTWTTDDGRNISYTFTGSAASQKDIDASRELGAK